MNKTGYYSEIVTALRMCGYPGSVYWCGHGCPFSVNGGTCDLHALRSAAASAIDDLDERLQDYRTAVRRVSTPLFDREDVYPDCTVQVLTNTATGETSVGWWENKREVEAEE